MDNNFTEQLQEFLNTPDDQKDYAQGALLLLQFSGNAIMYRNISVYPKGHAEFINGKLNEYLKFRLQQLTHEQVVEMQQQVNTIVEQHTEFKENNPAADFKAGKRADHDLLPEDIQALYVENLDIVHRMREVHLKLRSLSQTTMHCPDSEHYPFLKELIALDKKLHANWDAYDHYVMPEANASDVAKKSATVGVSAPADPSAGKDSEEKAPETKPKSASKKKATK